MSSSVALVALLFTFASVRPQDAQDLPREKAYALLDRFDPLDTTELPFGRVSRGLTVISGDAPPRTIFESCFLLRKDSESFTFRTLGGMRRTYSEAPSGPESVVRIAFEPLDLAAYARELAERLTAAKSRGEELAHYVTQESPMSPRAEALILARACARRGVPAEERALWDAAGPPFRAMEDLFEWLRHRLAIDFADPRLPRSVLLQRHRLWLDESPFYGWRREGIDARTRILERMVAEESSAGNAPTPSADTPKDERARALVRALQEETLPLDLWRAGAYELVQFEAAPPEEDRACTKLRDLGLEAVPALIDALSDDRFSRCVVYSSRHGGGFSVIQVDTLAEEILREISGVWFSGRREGGTQAAWRGWWESLSRTGEEQTLAEIAGRGDEASVDAARRLLARWPGRVEDVLAAVRRAETPWLRRDLVAVVLPVTNERVTEFLLQEVETGPFVEARVVAARGLLDRGRREGLARCIAEWATAGDPKESAAPDERTRFLLGSGDLEVLRSVARDLMQRSPPVREAVAKALLFESLETLLARAAPAVRADVERVIEGILVQLLDDRQRLSGSYGFPFLEGYVQLVDPRASDFAGCALASHWPDRYAFDPRAPTRARDRGLLEMKNAWRVAEGSPPIAPPELPELPSLDAAQARLLDRLVSGESGDPVADLGRLETAGLAALPGIEDRLRALAPDHPARESLRALADRLANLLGRVECSGIASERLGSLRALLDAMRGKPLDVDGIGRVLLAAIQALPGTCGDLSLRIDRLGDGRGVSLQVELAPSPCDDGKIVDRYVAITVNGRTLEIGGGPGLRPRGNDRIDVDDQRRNLEAALATHHDETFEILVELRLR